MVEINDELIEEQKEIGNSLIGAYRNFGFSLQAVQNRCERLIQSVGSEEISIQDFPNQLEENLVCTEFKIKKIRTSLDRIKEKMTEVKESEKDMNVLIIDYERKKRDLEKKISAWNEKKKKIEDNRNRILMYKLLTGIHFSFEGVTVNGYVENQKSKKLKPFNLNPEQLSQKQITDALYDVVKRASVEEPETSESTTKQFHSK